MTTGSDAAGSPEKVTQEEALSPNKPILIFRRRLGCVLLLHSRNLYPVA
jgi:hypothetical protein